MVHTVPFGEHGVAAVAGDACDMKTEVVVKHTDVRALHKPLPTH